VRIFDLTFHNRYLSLNTPPGSVSTSVIRQQMKKGKTKGVVAVIDRWNHVSWNYQLSLDASNLTGYPSH